MSKSKRLGKLIILLNTIPLNLAGIAACITGLFLGMGVIGMGGELQSLNGNDPGSGYIAVGIIMIIAIAALLLGVIIICALATLPFAIVQDILLIMIKQCEKKGAIERAEKYFVSIIIYDLILAAMIIVVGLIGIIPTFIGFAVALWFVMISAISAIMYLEWMV